MLRNFVFVILRNFHEIFNFVKLEENFTNFFQNYETKILQLPYSYTICRLLLTLPFRLLEDPTMRRCNATLR